MDDETSISIYTDAEVRTISTLFWVLTILTCIYYIALMALLYARRNYQPVKARPFRTVFLMLPMFMIYSVSLALRWLVTDGTLPCIVFVFLTGPSLTVVLNTGLARIWMLWFQYKSTRAKVDMYRLPTQGDDCNANGTTKCTQPTSMWYIKNAYLGSDKFLFRLFSAKTILEIVFVMWTKTFVLYPEVFDEYQDPSGEFCPTLTVSTWTLVGIGFVDGIIYAYAAVKYSSHELKDGFYLKSDMKIIGIWTIVLLIVFAILGVALGDRSDPAQLACLMISTSMNAGFTVVYPVWKSYKLPQACLQSQASISTSVSATTAATFEDFRAFLEDEDGRNAFRKHLELEFSVENLFFWEAVEAYKKAFDESKPSTNLQMAQTIISRFVDEDSPLQVNLSYTSARRIGEEIAKDSVVVPRDLFDGAAASIFRLMASDSFPRFQTSSRRLLEQTHSTKTVDDNPVCSPLQACRNSITLTQCSDPESSSQKKTHRRASGTTRTFSLPAMQVMSTNERRRSLKDTLESV